MIIFQSILTFFKLNFVFRGSCGSCINPPSTNLTCPNPWNTLYVDVFSELQWCRNFLKFESLFFRKNFLLDFLIAQSTWDKTIWYEIISKFGSFASFDWFSINISASLKSSTVFISELSFLRWELLENYNREDPTLV